MMKGASQIAPFGLRMPEELKDAIAERAKQNGRSMNSEIIEMLSTSLFSSSIDKDAVDYILGITKSNELDSLLPEEKNHADRLLIKIAEKLTSNIEKDSSNLKQILELLTHSKKNTLSESGNNDESKIPGWGSW